MHLVQIGQGLVLHDLHVQAEAPERVVDDDVLDQRHQFEHALRRDGEGAALDAPDLVGEFARRGGHLRLGFPQHALALLALLAFGGLDAIALGDLGLQLRQPRGLLLRLHCLGVQVAQRTQGAVLRLVGHPSVLGEPGDLGPLELGDQRLDLRRRHAGGALRHPADRRHARPQAVDAGLLGSGAFLALPGAALFLGLDHLVVVALADAQLRLDVGREGVDLAAEREHGRLGLLARLAESNPGRSPRSPSGDRLLHAGRLGDVDRQVGRMRGLDGGDAGADLVEEGDRVVHLGDARGDLDGGVGFGRCRMVDGGLVVHAFPHSS